MKKYSYKLSYFVVCLTLFSCGKTDPTSGADGSSNTGDKTPASIETASVVKSVSDLPACSSNNDGGLVYIKQTNEFRTCSESSWSKITIKGETSLVSVTDESAGSNCANGGKKITSGIDADFSGVLESSEIKNTSYVCNGISGASGTNGNDNKIVGTISCNGSLQGSSLNFIYNAALLNSGDVLVAGSISGGLYQISNSLFYSSKQSGSLNAAIGLVYDVFSTSNGGWWTLTLDRNSLVTTITYNDSEMINGSTVSGQTVVDNKLSWTMTADKCVKNTY